MKLINKEGMIFGKVNIIDLCIVVFIIAALALGFMKVTEDKGPIFVNASTGFSADILLRSVYDGFQEDINEGDVVYDHKSGAVLGTVTSKTVTPAVAEVETASGEIVLSKVPNRWDVVFTIEGEGSYNADKGMNFGGEIRYIGLYFRMRTKTFIVDGVIIDLEVDGE